MSARRKGPNQ